MHGKLHAKCMQNQWFRKGCGNMYIQDYHNFSTYVIIFHISGNVGKVMKCMGKVMEVWKSDEICGKVMNHVEK